MVSRGLFCWLSSVWALPGLASAAVERPVVVVFNLPGGLAPAETAVLPELPTLPAQPVQPAKDAGDTEAWQAYQAALQRYESARVSVEKVAALRRDMERAAREARRQRTQADVQCANLTQAAESAVRRLRLFDVLTAHRARRALGEAADALRGCVPGPCLAPLVEVTRPAYIVALHSLVSDSAIAATLIRLVDRRPQVLAQGELPSAATNIGAIVAELFTPAMVLERDHAIAEGHKALGALDWGSARDWAARALLLEPEHGEAHYTMGRARLGLGELSTAERHLEQAVATGARTGDASFLLGLVAERRGRLTQAVSAYTQALEHGHDAFLLRLFLGRHFFDSDAELAFTHLSSAVQMRPEHGEVNDLLARYWMAKKAPDKAETHFVRSARAGTNAGHAHHALGLMAAGRQAWPDAQSRLEAARELGTTSVEALLVLAKLYAENVPDKALLAWDEARRKGASSEELDFLMGNAALAAGKTSTALMYLRRASKAGGRQQEAAITLGQTYRAMGNVPASARHFKQAMELGHDSFEAHVVLGQAARLRGDDEAAIRHFAAALGRRSDHGPTHLVLAQLLVAKSQWERAASHAQQALEHREEPALAHELLGRSAEASGQPAVRLKHFRAAANAGSQNPDLYRWLARAAHQAGEFREAESRWLKLLELVPGDAEASFQLGVMWAKAGDADRSRPLLEHVAMESNYGARANQALGRLAAETGHYRDALTFFEKALRAGQPSYELFAEMGWTALSAEDVERARQYLLRALAFRPQDGKLNYELGRMMVEQGELARAKPFLENAVAARYQVEHAAKLLRATQTSDGPAVPQE